MDAAGGSTNVAAGAGRALSILALSMEFFVLAGVAKFDIARYRILLV